MATLTEGVVAPDVLLTPGVLKGTETVLSALERLADPFAACDLNR